VDVGLTGFAIKRPVLASACENGCPWGELGDFVTEAMQPFGYDVLQCRNCDLDRGAPLVSKAGRPPPIGITDTFVGTTTTVNAPVDFGITAIGFLEWAYGGLYNYAPVGPYATGTPGPFKNLRLIAKIEDVTYLLVAVKASLGMTDLSQIAQKKMPVAIIGGGSPISQPVLDYYGLTQAAVTAWGGSFQNAIVAGTETSPTFDVVVNELGSPANNPESAIWEKVSQANDLRFLDLPSDLLDKLVNDKTLGLTRATVKYGLLRGVDRPIATVARSGHAVFARDDTPEQAAYDTAKAIDQHRDALKWYIRPYAYDSRTAWQDATVPLHPGAERYYREMGYLQGSGGGTCPPTASGGCTAAGQSVAGQWLGALAAALAALAGRRMRCASALAKLRRPSDMGRRAERSKLPQQVRCETRRFRGPSPARSD
jgi:TRAP-type uncharacterized transport system substrate-binding protein